MALPDINEAVATGALDTLGSTQLVAYVVTSAPLSTNPAEIRKRLAVNLPDYMVPSVIVFLDEMPKTVSGKVNRLALPAPVNVRTNSGVPYVAPRTKIEASVCDMWKELLAVDEVGIDDSFLDLGGQSLTALGFVVHVNETYDIEMSVAELFDVGTIREIVELITIALLEDVSNEFDSVP